MIQSCDQDLGRVESVARQIFIFFSNHLWGENLKDSTVPKSKILDPCVEKAYPNISKQRIHPGRTLCILPIQLLPAARVEKVGRKWGGEMV